MNWIYLSPHLDDVALSCGGMIWEQRRAGHRVSIWTICAGDPPADALSSYAVSLHQRWQAEQQAVEQRRFEDIVSCSRLSVAYRHFSIPDCIYRRSSGEGQANLVNFLQPYYDSEEAIFGSIHPAEASLVDELCSQLVQELPADIELVCPLAIRGHVDHRLVRAAAERLGREMWYYADYPHLLYCPEELEALQKSGWKLEVTDVSTAGLDAWQQAVAAHASQISTFWPDLPAMRSALQSYLTMYGGAVLWRPARQ